MTKVHTCSEIHKVERKSVKCAKIYKITKITVKVVKLARGFWLKTHLFSTSELANFLSFRTCKLSFLPNFSYTLQFSTWCLGVLGIISLLSIGCQTQKSLPNTLSLEIDTRNGQPLRQALYGFNTNMMSGDYGYLDDDFVALTKTLAPKTLRFPGGTVGNFYHWKQGGFFQNEMASTLNTKLNKRNRDNYVKLQKRRKGKILFDDFMQLCNTLNITPVVMVNLWTGSPEESAAWVRYAKDKGYQVKHWELGNEYYLPHYLNKYPTVRAYIAEAKKHAAAMKAVNPDIKVSVCATPIAFHKEGVVGKNATTEMG